MKIKQLEISGFKSFADKVVLDFQQCVTGVVGPNGCGKSNIVDAIRWCMGEQSAKNLRGKAMEDIIFAGSETRKPLGVAEVSLIFSTEDGRAPAKYLDYAEIQLTRRLYRDGESEYLINKTPCRLLDITELFMDTGVGTRAYSIIEQGKIGQILHSRPEERRFLIEEAAGVTKFKARKQLALKKIDGTKQNLARLADVLGEIRRQLTSLQRQAKKAEKFREFRDELRSIELFFSVKDYQEARRQLELAESELTVLDTAIEGHIAATAASETKAEGARIFLVEVEKQLTVAQEEIFRVRSEFDKTGNTLEFQRKEAANIETRLVRLSAEAAELEKRHKECAEQQSLLELRRDTGAVDVAAMQADLDSSEAALKERQQLEDNISKDLELRRSELFTALAEAAQHKNRSENAKKRLVALHERSERQSREALQLAERKDQLIKRSESLEKEITQVKQSEEAVQIRITDMRKHEEELRQKLPETEKKWQSSRDELNRNSSRLHSLKELEAQFAGFGQGVRTLMKDPVRKSHFSGVLADAIQAPPELETALEAALADRLQCILCNDDNAALEALDFLRQNKGGRVGIAVPLSTPIAKTLTLAGAKSLAPLVQLTGPFSGLLSTLLAGVLLTDSISTALELARKHPDLVFVCKDGQMVTGGGIISGGSSDQAGSGIIHKKREIRELEISVAELEKLSATLGKQRDDLRRQSQEVSDSLKNDSAELHRLQLQLANMVKDRQQAAEECQRIKERLDVQQIETAGLAEERTSLETELEQSEKLLAQHSVSSKGLEVETTRLKSELDAAKISLTAFREKITALRIQTATVKEQQDAGTRAMAELERQKSDIERRMTADNEEKFTAEKNKLQLLADINASTERLEQLAAMSQASEERLTQVRSVFENANIALAAADNQLKADRGESDRLRQSAADTRLRFSTLSMQAEHLVQSLQERSRISIDEALAKCAETFFDYETGKARQSELNRQIDEMGEVNLMAIEECAGMEERYNFLSGQKDDLEESMHSLQQAIQRINRTTRQRFQETYNLINAKFQEVFPRLFCGGHAELRLTDEEDLLETGIDIIVQPPGKKLQNVTLLSGGEKALTAVALIFSIFQIKPTPFCLLDEVDAPLDDANIGRFNEMVREMSAMSQFIIITHNKATMQVADTLYGITMEEPGASRVVSVRMH